MKSGDTVQVQQDAEHWIYATVITANEDGSALVQIRHPANVDDNRLMGFPAAKLRTKATVQASVDAMLAANNGRPPVRDTPVGREYQSLMNQIEWLS
jgi:hypothetical protein